MKEFEANKQAWDLLAEDHYHSFKQQLENQQSLLNPIIEKEIGDITNKTLIHLQCNTGADSISLARKGAKITGVDLAPRNIIYANKLAEDFKIDANFIESNIYDIPQKQLGKFDIVFTSEGAIGWLNDLNKWAEIVRSLLKEDGYFYIFDAHPFFMALDEDLISKEELVIKYPYFDKEPDISNTIGGYASESKEATSYFWMYTISDIINALIKAGLQIEYFNEYDTLFWNNGNMEKIDKSLYVYPFLRNKLPFTFSLKATVRKK